MAILSRCHVFVFFKLLGEVRMVVKTSVLSDGGDRIFAACEGLGGGVDAHLGDVFERGDFEDGFKLAVKLRDREMGEGGEFLNLDGLRVVVHDVLNDVRHLLVGFEDGAGRLEIAHDACDTNGLLLMVEQWDFGDDVPSERAVVVGDQVNVVASRFGVGHDEFVFGGVGVGQIGVEEIVVGFADHLRFVVKTERIEQGAVNEDKAAGLIFGKEVGLWEKVEERGNLQLIMQLA